MTTAVAAINLTDFVPIVPVGTQPTTNPAAVYLAGLARMGRRAMAGQLRWVAAVVRAEREGERERGTIQGSDQELQVRGGKPRSICSG
jgi:hypothetical protein